ncbi:MAG: hypothetical protein GXY48_00340 [Methanomicrobiales archaeon]|nr:hypothetical protein [Methanomicrobiales archaeon]
MTGKGFLIFFLVLIFFVFISGCVIPKDLGSLSDNHPENPVRPTFSDDAGVINNNGLETNTGTIVIENKENRTK